MSRAAISSASRLTLVLLAVVAFSGDAPNAMPAHEQVTAPSSIPLDLRNSPSRIVTVDEDSAAASALELSRDWSGDFCKPSLVNKGARPVRVREVVLFSIAHTLPAETTLYGESFQMLSQTAGTVGRPVDLGYSELKHYRIPQPADASVSASGLLTLQPPSGDTLLLGFTSAQRFIGRFYLRPGRLDIVVDTEGLTLEPGGRWTLEELLVASGPRRPDLLDRLATRITEHHAPLRFPSPPAGWCSWYCFGPKVTAQQVLDNLDVIAKRIPPLQYVQIDDGYQPAMGDWLETGQAFGGDVQGVLKAIRTRGFQPAIWVAPFIAEAGSRLFKEHPDWFMRDAAGRPLPSNSVTFGGWRRGPWYALDGTHPEAQRHLESVFRTMRNEWGVTYFKLDANFWGAMHSAKLHDPNATRIEAYRRGMQAVLRGAGNSFILGCNHPIWPSFGLIHGSRSSNDIKRTWVRIKETARQNLGRNWQNGRLWWNDPDAVVLTGDLSDDELLFHATSIVASGGMVLSGDDLTAIPPARLEMLRKLLPPTGVAARFADDTLRVGVIGEKDGSIGRTWRVAVFNWDDTPRTIPVPLPAAARIRDAWTGADLGRHATTYTLEQLPPHSARLLDCTREP